MHHADELRRCLVDLDIAAMRKLWRHISPHLPQPETDVDVLYAMHLARTKAKSVPKRLREYSECWLKERETGRIVHAVGIAVGAPAHRLARALEIRAAMSDAVVLAVKAGIDLKTESHEVKRRMLIARAAA